MNHRTLVTVYDLFCELKNKIHAMQWLASVRVGLDPLSTYYSVYNHAGGCLQFVPRSPACWVVGCWPLGPCCCDASDCNALMQHAVCLLVRTWTCLVPACLPDWPRSLVHTPREWRCAHCWCMSVCVQTFTNLQTFHSTWVSGVLSFDTPLTLWVGEHLCFFEESRCFKFR
jgi:hypothetical protein